MHNRRRTRLVRARNFQGILRARTSPPLREISRVKRNVIFVIFDIRVTSPRFGRDYTPGITSDLRELPPGDAGSPKMKRDRVAIFPSTDS